MSVIYRERAAGKVQAIVRRNGLEASKTFTGHDAKKQAEVWGVLKDAEFLDAADGGVAIPKDKTFGDLLNKYRDDVVSKKRGAKWETDRINRIVRDDPIAKVPLTEFSARAAAQWAEKRLAEVSVASVLREWTILSHACSKAVKPAWAWLRSNPFKDIDRPKPPQARDRRPEQKETDALLYTLNCDPQATPGTKTARVGFAWLFAIETAMRAGEIIGLRWKDIDGRVAHVGGERHEAGHYQTKSGLARDVPLTKEALRLLSLLPRGEADEPVFQLNSAQLDVLFRNGTKKALIKDLHFHDSRREGLTRLAAKVDVMTLAKISGHRDLRILQNTYYAPRMQEIANLLD